MSITWLTIWDSFIWYTIIILFELFLSEALKFISIYTTMFNEWKRWRKTNLDKYETWDNILSTLFELIQNFRLIQSAVSKKLLIQCAQLTCIISVESPPTVKLRTCWSCNKNIRGVQLPMYLTLPIYLKVDCESLLHFLNKTSEKLVLSYSNQYICLFL